MLIVTEAHDPIAWNSFLADQKFRPFLQSWEMGEVYREIGQEPVRLEVQEGDEIVGICFGHVVPARRGRHLSIPYGPVVSDERLASSGGQVLQTLIEELKRIAKETGCAFIRLSPFMPKTPRSALPAPRSARPAPLHLLAEHLWYLPLVEPDPWSLQTTNSPSDRGRVGKLQTRTEAELLSRMRATTRNLIRRAEKEGVTITASDDPIGDLPLFLKLHEETRKRHGFTPYTDAFFRAQVKHFPPPTPSSLPFGLELRAEKQPTPSSTLYLAYYKGVVIATSIHMHFGEETSYHHGASTQKERNIPASYLLQWRAIQDAIARGDNIYNFWGIAPSPLSPCKKILCPSKHPFAGVTLFKTGFGGKLLELQHCMDLPLKPTYYLTRTFEILRKWRRGF